MKQKDETNNLRRSLGVFHVTSLCPTKLPVITVSPLATSSKAVHLSPTHNPLLSPGGHANPLQNHPIHLFPALLTAPLHPLCPIHTNNFLSPTP